MILSQKILHQLITEALSQMEAECLAQFAPANHISPEFRGREGTAVLAKILMDRARDAGKSWDDYLAQRKEMEGMYPKLTDLISDALVNCLARKEMEAGSQRAHRSPRMRPGGAGDAADETLVGFVTEQMIMEELSKEEACCIAYWSPGYSSIIKSKIAQFTGDPDGGKARKAALVCELSDAIAANYKTNNKDWKDYRAAWEKKYQNPDNPDATKVKNLTYEKIVKCVEGMMRNAELDACYSCDPADYEKYEKEEDEWNAPGGDVTMELEELRLRKMVMEELTKTDKAEIKKMISDEMEKSLKPELKKILQDELIKELGSKKTKEEVGEIAKKVIKKLYKDLSFHHPYIIDRIKV